MDMDYNLCEPLTKVLDECQSSKDVMYFKM